MDEKLQRMIDELVMYYETSGGYENFYEEEIVCRTAEQIYELYEETFSEGV